MKRFITVLTLIAALALPGSAFAQAASTSHAKPVSMQNGAKPNSMQTGAKREGEKHPEIRAAMNHLRQAKNILENKASNDFEGHKHEAVESIERALEHLNQALNSNDKGEKK
jgi:Spy/CpxP family protein refolding chaperone